jgi:hypothetical protein
MESETCFICEGDEIGDAVSVVMFTDNSFPRATTAEGRVQTAADRRLLPTRVRRRRTPDFREEHASSLAILVQPDRRPSLSSFFPRTFPRVAHGQNIEPRIARKCPEQVLTPIAVTTEPDFNDAHSVSVVKVIASQISQP